MVLISMHLLTRGLSLAIILVISLVLLDACPAQADIYRWDNGELIPRTERIEPGPGVDLTRLSLEFAALSNLDLSGASIWAVTLTNADFSGTNLSKAALFSSRLMNANLADANLNEASFTNAKLLNANLTGALINGTSFADVTEGGFTKEQFYSTASYQSRNLEGVKLGPHQLGPISSNDLTGWDFRSQDLTHAVFTGAILTDADLSGAIVDGAVFSEARFTREQFYSTASYQEKSLRGLEFIGSDLAEWDFRDQDLANTSFYSANVSGVDFRGSDLRNVDLLFSRGFDSVIFDSATTYNQWTVFDIFGEFDPVQAGLSLNLSPAGDVNADDSIDLADVVSLVDRIRTGDRFAPLRDSKFDVDLNSEIDEQDLRVWVEGIKGTWFGDADLDGEFTSGDLVAVFRAGEYNDAVEDNSIWASGDWNADGDFTPRDLVLAFEDGGYENGPRPAAAAVPEPTPLVLLVTALFALAIRQRFVVA